MFRPSVLAIFRLYMRNLSISYTNVLCLWRYTYIPVSLFLLFDNTTGMTHLKKIDSHCTDFYEIWYLSVFFRKSVGKVQVWSKSDNHNRCFTRRLMYTRVNKNPSAWNFLSPKPEVTCGTVAIIIRVVLLSPHLRIRAVSLSSIHYNQSHRVYINRRRRYICLIWN